MSNATQRDVRERGRQWGAQDPEPTKQRFRNRQRGGRHPAGSKLLLRWFKNHNGVKAESLDEARRWYAGYLKEADAKARAVEEARRIVRAEHRRQSIKDAA